jgi:hypothetical protein
MKRIFTALVGLGAGVALGVWAVRKVEQTGQRLRPDALAASAGVRASSFGERLRDAVEEGRAAAAAKEAELRANYGRGRSTTQAP